MSNLWKRWLAAIRAQFAAVQWVEPSNDVTRIVLESARPAVIPNGPLYSRDPHDLVFTIDQLLYPAVPVVSAPSHAPDVAGPAKPSGRRRPRRAA